MIRLQSLSKKYPDGIQAVNNLSLEVKEGEICILIGPSGCGKTTTLMMINRLIENTSGDVFIKGKSIYDLNPSQLRRNIGYVIQEIALFPHLTVEENIEIVPELKGWSREKKEKRVFELLNLIGMDLEIYKDKYPYELSGGQKQRIGVARGMGGNPPIMLMDEPFGAIDPITRSRLQDEFLSIQEQVKKTIIFVTHDINEALKMGDKLAMMQEGELVQFGSPREILSQPVNSFVEDFIGTDRSLKWLRLVRVEEYMIKNIEVATYEESSQKILQKMDQMQRDDLMIVDNHNRLKGYILRKDISEKNKQSIKDIIRPFRENVEKKTTILDAFIRLTTIDADFLAVLDNNSRVEGLITGEILHKQMNKANQTEENGGANDND